MSSFAGSAPGAVREEPEEASPKRSRVAVRLLLPASSPRLSPKRPVAAPRSSCPDPAALTSPASLARCRPPRIWQEGTRFAGQASTGNRRLPASQSAISSASSRAASDSILCAQGATDCPPFPLIFLSASPRSPPLFSLLSPHARRTHLSAASTPLRLWENPSKICSAGGGRRCHASPNCSHLLDASNNRDTSWRYLSSVGGETSTSISRTHISRLGNLCACSTRYVATHGLHVLLSKV